MENKITIKEFWNSKKSLAIHCKTEEQANKLLNAFDKLGKRWHSGASYLKINYWSIRRENTCYDNDNHCGNFKYFKEHDYKIYEFEDVDLGE